MEKERERAYENNYESPIQPSKAATDEHYNTALRFCVDNYEDIVHCPDLDAVYIATPHTGHYKNTGVIPVVDRVLAIHVIMVSGGTSSIRVLVRAVAEGLGVVFSTYTGGEDMFAEDRNGDIATAVLQQVQVDEMAEVFDFFFQGYPVGFAIVKHVAQHAG